MGKKIYVIQGHPDSTSFSYELADAYVRGAGGEGDELKRVNLAELDFELSVPNPSGADMEPDLVKCQEDVLWAEHIVLVYPIWWGSMSALLKGFLDRVFIQGFAYSLRPDSQLWEKLLNGRSARAIMTMDGPVWHNHLMYGKPAEKMVQKSVLEFCGIHPVHLTNIGPVDEMTEHQKELWLQKMESAGSDRN